MMPMAIDFQTLAVVVREKTDARSFTRPTMTKRPGSRSLLWHERLGGAWIDYPAGVLWSLGGGNRHSVASI